MYVDEEMTQRDPEIGGQLEKMAEEIKAAMTGPALKFYEREFAFFRKVTNISGIIRPYPKGPQRNAECLKALKEVELLPGEITLSINILACSIYSMLYVLPLFFSLSPSIPLSSSFYASLSYPNS